jgi:ABC-type nitrate/sulfonate/bicarbonate transport system permease component
MSKLLTRLNPVIGVILLVLVWWIATVLEVADPVLLPPPQKALKALLDGLITGPLLHDFAQTIYRTVLAFLIASAIAIPLGVMLGAADKVYRSVEFVIDFFRSTPASAVFPLFLVLFGVGDKTKIAVAAFGSVLVILFNVAYGVMNARKTRVLAAKVMGANRLQVLKDVYFWESLPQTFIGMRNGISLSLVIIVVAEMFIGSTDGIGHRLIEAQMLFEMPTMYAAIFAAGALGYGMNWIFLMVEKSFVHWGGK